MRYLLILLSIVTAAVLFAGGPMGNDLSGGPQVNVAQATTVAPAADIRNSAYALSFDGVDDFASASRALMPATASARTFMCWYYDSAPTSGEKNIFYPVVSTIVGREWGMNIGPGNFVMFGGDNGSGIYKAYTRVATWSHYVCTLPEGGNKSAWKVTINGTAIATDSSTGAVNTDTGGVGFFLAYNPRAGTGFCAAMKVAEVSVWNRVLTSDEINTYKYQKLTGSETGLVRLYHCDEGTGTTLTDATGNGYNATLVNSPTWVTRDIP